jgi:hypothetical protein
MRNVACRRVAVWCGALRVDADAPMQRSHDLPRSRPRWTRDFPERCSARAELARCRPTQAAIYDRTFRSASAPRLALAGAGLDVGRDGADPATLGHPGRRFRASTSGTVHEVTVGEFGEPFVDLGTDAAGTLMRH